MREGGHEVRRLGACRRVREQGPKKVLEPFVTGSWIPRQGNPILSGDETVGEVTSGTLSPSLGFGIGMGYLRPILRSPERRSRSTCEGKRRTAVVRERPLYSKD